MNGLQFTLNEMFGGQRAKPKPKSQLFAVYPDGSESRIYRKGNWWCWFPPRTDKGGGGLYRSSHLDNLTHIVETQYGGRVERRPL